MGVLDIWIVAHRDLADSVFAGPIHDRLLQIRRRLEAHGYKLKLDVGKRSTRATVTSPTIRVKTTYKTLQGFMAFEEARLAKMDEARP